MNINAVWKYFVLLGLFVFALIYALPNLYVAEPGLQIIGIRDTEVDQRLLNQVSAELERNNIAIKTASLDGERLKVRLHSEAEQAKAKVALRNILTSDKYGIALADLPTTPQWLQSANAVPMYLGLDLRGGVHFLLQVDMDAAKLQAENNYIEDIRNVLQKAKIRYRKVQRESPGKIQVRFSKAELRDSAFAKLQASNPELQLTEYDKGNQFYIVATISELSMSEIQKAALSKNMIALRNRIDQLGVSEPVIQQQGLDRIVVQLPGVKDPAEAKEILGKTATLEVRLVDDSNALQANSEGLTPPGTKRFYFRDGTPIILKKRIVLSGDNIINASSGIDPETGGSIVNITLDGKGASIWSKVTGQNINKLMAVVYVEDVVDKQINADGEEVLVKKHVEEVITAPRILSQLGRNFMITGLDGQKEARNLALLLKAGSLAAPMFIVEERTVGPSLGKDNIDKGFQSVLYGFLAVLIFMVIYYRFFGAVASVALVLNLLLIVAVLSLIQATLTLPGVAGLVLTVGMAVDANVLIFERIREELREGSSPQLAIHRGYDNAFSTIVDANITTLIAALVLFTFGTGPIKGFAITLSIGILTSMITAIFVSRIIINKFYGQRRVEKLSI